VNQSEPANEPIWTNAVSTEIYTFVVEKNKNISSQWYNFQNYCLSLHRQPFYGAIVIEESNNALTRQ
jgi:hypothetical protein